jgi:DNA-binding response OmpR family regulator
MARGRALVVESDWRMRKLVRTNLEALGLEVVEAVSTQECGAALRERPCDLVLVDADLPAGNGWNLVVWLRHTPEATDLPIIVLVPEPARNRLLRRFPRVSALVKPFSASDLVACVECALAGDADR